MAEKIFSIPPNPTFEIITLETLAMEKLKRINTGLSIRSMEALASDYEHVHYWSKPDIAGYLNMRGTGLFKLRKKTYWFVLKKGFLFWFKDSSVTRSVKPIGALELTLRHTVDQVDYTSFTISRNRTYMGSIFGRSDKLHLDAASSDEKLAWMRKIESRITDDRIHFWFDPTLANWLSKRCDLNKDWNPRWVVLKGEKLFWFDDNFVTKKSKPLGSVKLKPTCSVQESDSDPLVFELITIGKIIYFRCNSTDQKQLWMKVIEISIPASSPGNKEGPSSVPPPGSSSPPVRSISLPHNLWRSMSLTPIPVPTPALSPTPSDVSQDWSYKQPEGSPDIVSSLNNNLTNPENTGFLFMLHNNEWKYYWFALKKGILYRFQDYGCSKPQENIVVSSNHPVMAAQYISKPYSFHLSNGSVSIHLAATSEKEMNGWIKSIRKSLEKKHMI